MNLQAAQFDLVLLTAGNVADSDQAEIRRLQQNFTKCRDWLADVNRRLAQNPALRRLDLAVRMMITSRFQQRLSDFYSQRKSHRQSALGGLHVIVSQFIDNQARVGPSVLFLNQEQINRIYTLKTQEFIPATVANHLNAAWDDLSRSWVAIAGDSAFDSNHGLLPAGDDLYSTWIVSWGRNLGRIVNNDEIEVSTDAASCPLPVFWHSNFQGLEWECFVRERLWQDPRLPFWGPAADGHFGYQPPDEWRPGEPVPTARHDRSRGPLDRLGGIWIWGRRAGANIFNGHWDIQLPNGRSRNQWLAYIKNQNAVLREQDLKPISIARNCTHINVEPTTGQITDTEN